jgi:hypothetical protein
MITNGLPSTEKSDPDRVTNPVGTAAATGGATSAKPAAIRAAPAREHSTFRDTGSLFSSRTNPWAVDRHPLASCGNSGRDHACFAAFVAIMINGTI